MPQNIEIKAQLQPGQLEEIQEKATSRSDEPPEIILQKDTFYTVPKGRLKLREFGDGTAELIAYDRTDQEGPKVSSYTLYPTEAPDSLSEALSTSLEIRGIVQKERLLILVGQTRVHLDQVEGLGEFMELEVVLTENQTHKEGVEIAQELMEFFGIDHDSLISHAYIDMLETQVD